MATADRPRRLPAGVWRGLLTQALRLIDEIARHGLAGPFWTLGGGTVLMLRYRHRRSKDIDIFVPDPQFLGFVTPRLSDVAHEVARDYVEGPDCVKLIRVEGEIDFVAAPNLTVRPFETWTLLRRPVRVESAVEVVAKKLWYRGDRVTARDLFDLSLVIEREPDALAAAAPIVARHRSAFLAQLESRRDVLKAQFEAIDVLGYRPRFADAAARAARFLGSLPDVPPRDR